MAEAVIRTCITCSLKKFPSLFQRSFVAHIFGNYNNICNGVFGMGKNSKFLKFVIETLKLNYEKSPGYEKRNIPEKTGPTFLTSMFVSNNKLTIPLKSAII